MKKEREENDINLLKTCMVSYGDNSDAYEI